MDNFLTWVDAPSEALIPTPIEDESNNYLRDEILQIQQLIVDKLDEQKINDTEEEDRSMDDSIVAQRIVDDMRFEKRRSDAILRAMAGFQKDSAKNELQLVPLKQKFPVSNMKPTSSEKLIDEMNHEVSRLQDQLASREHELQKLQRSTPKSQIEAEKKKILKLRESYLKSKRKDEKLRALQAASVLLQKEYDASTQRQKNNEQDFEKTCLALKADEGKLEQLNDDNASLRAKLVELESVRSTSSTGSDEKYIHRLKSDTERIRRETATSRVKLESLNSQIAEMQASSKETKISNEKVAKEVEEKKRALTALLKKKFNEAKKVAKKEDARRKVMELKTTLMTEKAELEKKKNEMAEMLPGKYKTVVELKNEIAIIEAGNRSRDKKIKDAIKQNEKLLVQIAKMDIPKVVSQDSINILDQTADIVVVGEKKGDVTMDISPRRGSRDTWKSAPRLPLDVTPIHAPPPRNREVSVDAITGIPPIKEWMTSTPLHKTRRQKSAEKAEKSQKQEKSAPKNSRKTRGAARRSAENAAAAIAAAASAKPEPTQKRRKKN